MHAPCCFVAMVSKKKARGKARRAAKEAKAVEEVEETAVVDHHDASLGAQMQRLTINNLLRDNSAVLQKCRHSFELEGREERLCFEFVDAFFDGYSACCVAGDDIGACLIEGTKATKEKFESVLKDVAMMENVVSFCLASGAQYILDGKESAVHFQASLACYFEQYIAFVLEETQPFVNMTLIAELQWADMNTLVNYFRKRIPCKCLDRKYKEVKSVIKMGLCANSECSLPERQVERKKMLCCTGCSGTYYCSYECQKSHWKRHKEECKRWAREKTEFESYPQV